MDFETQPVNTTHTTACDLAMEIARQFGRVRLRVSGMSMAPAVRPGDLLSVERAAVDKIVPGEIVVFAREGRLIAHRAVGRTEGASGTCLITRGDRARRNDRPITGEELIGRVTGIERDGNPVPARTRLSRAQQALARLLRFSDHATCLYLRLAAL